MLTIKDEIFLNKTDLLATGTFKDLAQPLGCAKVISKLGSVEHASMVAYGGQFSQP